MPALTPWEQRNTYYKGLKLGKDVNTLASSLNNQTKAMIATQLASTNAVIASQERIMEGQRQISNEISSGFDEVAIGIDRVSEGIAGLQFAFEWGISEIVWQIEQNREVLKSILDVLSAPLDTQSKELRKRAEEAYLNGWIDDALTDFLESEAKNRYDFAVHISLGNIYINHKNDNAKALEYFEKAIKYAKPKSAYYTSYALLHKGVIKYSEQQYQEALVCTEEAINSSPDMIEAYFQKSQYLAALGRKEEMLKILKQVILKDKYYCLKINKIKDFKPYMDSIYQLIKDLKDEIASRIREKMPQLDANAKIIARISQGESSNILQPQEINKFNQGYKKLENYLKRDSYYDLKDAKGLAFSVIYSQTDAWKKRKTDLEAKITSLKKDVDRETERAERYSSYNDEGYPNSLSFKVSKFNSKTDALPWSFPGGIIGLVVGCGSGGFDGGVTGLIGGALLWPLVIVIFNKIRERAFISKQKDQLRKEAQTLVKEAQTRAKEAEKTLDGCQSMLNDLNTCGYVEVVW